MTPATLTFFFFFFGKNLTSDYTIIIAFTSPKRIRVQLLIGKEDRSVQCLEKNVKKNNNGDDPDDLANDIDLQTPIANENKTNVHHITLSGGNENKDDDIFEDIENSNLVTTTSIPPEIGNVIFY